MPRASLPPLFLFQLNPPTSSCGKKLCLTAAYRSWNEKPVTKASVPFTAIVSLKQGEAAKPSAKHGTAGLSGGPAVATLLLCSSDLLLLVVVCLASARAAAGARGRLLCRHPTNASLVKLDKWIRGAQIWVGIFEEKTMEMFKGSVVVVVGVKEESEGTGRGKVICAV